MSGRRNSPARGATTGDGRRAESAACDHLRQRGLDIRRRNYRARRGEVDIIARDGDTLVFVEVRYRRRSNYGSAAETIDHRKQQRIICAAEEFLQANRLADKVSCRFDAVCVSPATGNDAPYHIEWLRDAFQPG